MEQEVMAWKITLHFCSDMLHCVSKVSGEDNSIIRHRGLWRLLKKQSSHLPVVWEHIGYSCTYSFFINQREISIVTTHSSQEDLNVWKVAKTMTSVILCFVYLRIFVRTELKRYHLHQLDAAFKVINQCHKCSYFKQCKFIVI